MKAIWFMIKFHHTFPQMPRFFLTLSLAAPAIASLLLCHPVMADSSLPAVVVTGRALEINGKAEIPRGLFGVHGMDVDEATAGEWGIDSVRVISQNPDGTPGGAGATAGNLSVVDCYFDRYQPALQISDRDWEQRLERLAATYGEKARASKTPHDLEFWNEPYLNWATKPGVNYAPTFYRTDGIKASDPMVLKTSGQAVDGLVWDREIFFVKKPDGNLDFVLTSYIPRDAVAGEPTKLGYGAGTATLTDGGQVHLRGKDHDVVKRWSGKDPGQEFYWSGPVNERLYNEMFAVFGKKLKATNPDVRLAAGWGISFFNENWEVWKRLIRPTIDKNHAWMDAVHEHHYGGDSRKVAASYETAYAYALGKYGKRLDFWNTEAGGHLDPQQPGNVPSANQGDDRTKAVAAMTYMLRDISYILSRNPDKGIHRAAHQPQINGGDKAAFQLLKPLRGHLIETESRIPGIWCAAASEGATMAVILFNDNNSPKEFPVRLIAPEGTRFAGLVERRPVLHPAAPFVRIEETEHDAGGAEATLRLSLDKKNACVLICRLTGIPAFFRVLARKQFVSPDILMTPKEGVLESRISVPAEAFPPDAPAILRIVADDLGQSPAISLNGKPIETGPPDLPIWDIPLPPGAVAADNLLQIRTTVPGARLLSSSIFIAK